ncbi:hypothetical protein L7F22_065728 [Adiantum nelumboides]|nr:hypothetical protein [Adiantum nelumboides]
MKEQLKYEDARFQKLTTSYNTVKTTLTALLQNQELVSAMPSTSASAAANTMAALQEELRTEKLQRQLLVSGFMSQTAQHEAKVKQLKSKLAKAKANLEAVGSLASTSQIHQAKTHLPIQPPLMPEMPEFQSTEEEEQPRPVPGALDIREQMEQEVEDMPEGPGKEYLLYEKKVMESAALAFLQPEEQIKDFGNDFLSLPLMRHEATLWKEKMKPAMPRNEEEGYEGIPFTSKEVKTLIEDHPRWRKKWLSERPRDLTNSHNTPQYLQIDPTYCPVPRRRSWAKFQKWKGKNKALLNYPVLSAQEPPTVNYVVNTLNQTNQLLREVPDLTCQMLVKIARMIITCIQVFRDTEDDDHPWNLFLEGLALQRVLVERTSYGGQLGSEGQNDNELWRARHDAHNCDAAAVSSWCVYSHGQQTSSWLQELVGLVAADERVIKVMVQDFEADSSREYVRRDSKLSDGYSSIVGHPLEHSSRSGLYRNRAWRADDQLHQEQNAPINEEAVSDNPRQEFDDVGEDVPEFLQHPTRLTAMAHLLPEKVACSATEQASTTSSTSLGFNPQHKPACSNLLPCSVVLSTAPMAASKPLLKRANRTPFSPLFRREELSYCTKELGSESISCRKSTTEIADCANMESQGHHGSLQAACRYHGRKAPSRADSKATLPVDAFLLDVVQPIIDDYDKGYFVTRNVSSRVYEEECEFADPAGSFKSLMCFKNNYSNFGSLLEKFDVKLVKSKELHDKFVAYWRLSCVLKFPWRPVLSSTHFTKYYFNAKTRRICRHVENWDVHDGIVEASVQAQSYFEEGLVFLAKTRIT